MQGRELRGEEDLVWNTDLIETMKPENLICQATQSLDSDVDSTGNRRGAAVAVHRRGGEVLEPLEDPR